MLLTQEPTFFIFMVEPTFTQEPTIRKCQLLLETKNMGKLLSYNEMNVVNTRTNILYIHGCHTRTNHMKNVSCYSYKYYSLSSLKANIQMPKFLKKIHAWLHEDMQQVKLGGMLGLRNVLFSSTFPFIILHISSPH
jgi:hypothetical protein